MAVFIVISSYKGKHNILIQRVLSVREIIQVYR